MNNMTREMLKTIEHDETLTAEERAILRKLRRGELQAPVPSDRILRRREAAARCGASLRTVDRWCALGLLKRVRLPGFQRASGIPESALRELIASNQGAPVHTPPALPAARDYSTPSTTP